jgi:gluconolactonase
MAESKNWWILARFWPVITGIWLAICFVPVQSGTCWSDEPYELGPDSMQHEGVPVGAVTKHRWEQSSIFPGTQRDYWVYVPAQYDASKPACVMVFQDGGGYVGRDGAWRVPNVFDNLIHRGEMPVTIGIFINPGVVPATSPETMERFNRSFEYDAMSDRYANFLTNEILPAVAKDFNLSSDPSDRAICGASSGAIAAFSVAWHRPDQFRRVLSTIGTYVGLRGGDLFPTLIRKTEPKPIRVFLQDGSNDLNIYGGDWWMANQDMLSALTWAGYDVHHTWGEGGHNSKQGGAILPDALRWLWREYPQSIEAKMSEQHELAKLLVPGEEWELVSEGHRFTEGPAVAPDGTVYFTDVPSGEIWRVKADQLSDGQHAELFAKDAPGASGLECDAEGQLYCCQISQGTVVRFQPDGSREPIASGIGCNDLVVVSHGIYTTDPRDKCVWYVPLESKSGESKSGQPRKVPGTPRKVAEGISGPNGIGVTPDQSYLCVVDAQGRYIWSFQIGNNGDLAHGQPYWYVHDPLETMRTGGDGVAAAADGWLYLATDMGIQVFDQPGRCHAIIPKPLADRPLSNVVFAGEDMHMMVVTSGDKVFRRKTNIAGVAPWQSPIKPEKPRL